jgi:hypothetical protein
MKISVSRISGGFERHPLCRSYSAIHIAAIRPDLEDSRSARCNLAFGVGALLDGHFDVLGVWLLLDWQLGRVSGNLIERGVKHFDVLVSDPGDGLAAPVLAYFPGAVAAPRPTMHASLKARSTNMKQHGVVDTLSDRARMRLRRGEECTGYLQQGLVSAMVQHGPFDRTEAAAAFVEAWLVGAGRMQAWRRSRAPNSRYPRLGDASAAR